MRNYYESDYALNKKSEGIVYKFADGSKYTIMLEEYLKDNPDKTPEDFAQLKAMSDEEYHQQDLRDTQYGKRARRLAIIENLECFATMPPDSELIHKRDMKQALSAATQLLDSGNLTEVQRRRFLLHFFQGIPIRQIAIKEKVSHVAVLKSIHLATEKLKVIFGK